MIQIETLLKLGIVEWILLENYDYIELVYLSVVSEKEKQLDDIYGNIWN